uniref:nuclear valosin-containing protein-like n=1 Tax=Styela clava TaxID=7725 RepID=UPI001939FBA1|nr:nuclear valosin-containing protein-like [Styela clava]
MSFLPSFDRRLVGRVRKYMTERRRVYVDDMADDLQSIYRQDYGRRKRNGFRKLVKQIHLSIVEERRKGNLNDLERQHMSKRRKEDSGHSSSSDSADDDECFVELSDHRLMNSSLMSLYKKQKKSRSMPSSPYHYVDCSTPASSFFEKPSIKNTEVAPIPEIPFVKEKKDIIDAVNNDDICRENESPEEEKIEIDKKTFHFFDSDFVSKENSLVENNDKPTLDKKTVTKTNIPSSTRKDRRRHRKSKKKETESKTSDGDIDIQGKDAPQKFKFQTTMVKFEDIGGNENTLREVCKLLVHMKHPEIYKTLGVIPPCGILLHGPPGCGKSLLANAIAGELSLPMLKIAATEIVSGVSGDSEQKLREMFEMALSSAPCIVFIDEIDAITPKREIASKDMERRIVAQLLSCLDDLSASPSQVLVIGATNRPDSIDPALRRAGRFDREICMGIPDEKAREDILRVLCKKLKLDTEFNYLLLARLTPGYVGADLMSLCREAAMCAVNRILSYLRQSKLDNSNNDRNFENISDKNCKMKQNSNPNIENENDVIHTNDSAMELSHSSSIDAPQNQDSRVEDNHDTHNNILDLQTNMIYNDLSTFELLTWLRETTPLTEGQLLNLSIKFSDFEHALPYVQPSAKREGFATVPDVTWDDIGALEDIREELAVAILAPVRNPAAFKSLGLNKPPGILLAGPPGCGKTLLAKAIANESGINFISVKGPELLNMYVGESERAVRQCFERARSSAPCVIFFDELDSLCPRRSGAESSSTARVVNQMLTEMDGLETRKHVFVMAATNRPDIIDPAVLRPGRLDKTLYIGLPKSEDRLKILLTITKNGTKPPMHDNVSLSSLSHDERCNRFTGADLSSLVREAAVNALKDHISAQHVFEKDSKFQSLNVVVNKEHFEKAFAKVKPSVSNKDEHKYEAMRRELQGY